MCCCVRAALVLTSCFHSRTGEPLARHPADKLPAGTPLPEGWGGTVAHDHTDAGLFREGPQPRPNPLQALIQSSVAQGEPLPPTVAQAALSRQGKRDARAKRLLARARVAALVPSRRVPMPYYARRKRPA